MSLLVHKGRQINSVKIGDVGATEVSLLNTGWSASGTKYVQTVAMSSMSSTAVPLVFLSPVGETATSSESSAFSLLTDVVSYDGSLKFYASEQPSTSINVIVKL